MTTLRWGSATDTGRLRDHNEDALLAEGNLFVVADGVGGHAAGEVAAQITVETLKERFDETRQGIVEAVQAANRAIQARTVTDPDTRGMGTTLSAVALVRDDAGEEMVLVVNVGDSRVYRIHRGELEQMSDDHSYVADLVREGRISPAEARTHPNRNIITRSLGDGNEVEVDSWLVDPEVGDRYLVCSDGLSDEVDDPTIARTLLTTDDPEEAARALVELANAAGGRDNITVIVVDVIDDGGRAATASAALAKDPPRTRSQTTVEVPPTPPKAAGSATVASSAPGEAPARRITWRVVVFAVAVAAVVGGAIAGTAWFARSTYHVGTDGEEIVIYRGRPGGLLLWDPTVERATGIPLDELPQEYETAIRNGHEAASLASAERYVARIEDRIEELEPPPQTTTTTSTPTTSPSAPTTTLAP